MNQGQTLYTTSAADTAGKALARTLPRRDRLRVGMDDELLAAIFGERERHSRRDGVDPIFRALRELAATRDALDRLESALVRQARFAGSTWSDVAADLGISRPTASRRHSRHDPIGGLSHRDR